MAVTKKPSIDADQFIGGAKADAVETETRESGQTVSRDTAKEDSRIEGEPSKRYDGDTENLKTAIPQKRNTAKTVKKTKLTFYMDPQMYLRWKEYELRQLQAGNKVTFQGVIEKYMLKILR